MADEEIEMGEEVITEDALDLSDDGVDLGEENLDFKSEDDGLSLSFGGSRGFEE